MLSRYDGKDVRVKTTDGLVFAGRADAYPSGYGLHEFGTLEESIQVSDTQIFLSEISSIDVPSEARKGTVTYDEVSALMEKLLEAPYWIVDVLPKQVPQDADGQYFAVDRYFRKSLRIAQLHRMHAEILLRLNCYFDMAVSFDTLETWETNPKPDWLVSQLVSLPGNSFMRALFVSQELMVDIDPSDTWITAYGTQSEALDLLQKLAVAEGLFCWQPT